MLLHIIVNTNQTQGISHSEENFIITQLVVVKFSYRSKLHYIITQYIML